MRREREDVNAHLLGVGEAYGYDNSPALEIDLPHTGLDERQRQTRVQLEHVVRRVVDHVAHAPEDPSSLLLDPQANELERVVLVLAELRQRRTAHRERGAAL